MKTKQSELPTIHLLHVTQDLLVPQTASPLPSHSLEEMQGHFFKSIYPCLRNSGKRRLESEKRKERDR